MLSTLPCGASWLSTLVFVMVALSPALVSVDSELDTTALVLFLPACTSALTVGPLDLPPPISLLTTKPVPKPVSYTHLRAHETREDLLSRLML